MTEFFAAAAILIWSIIATIVGSAVLLVVIGFLAHEFYAITTRLLTNTNNTQE